MSLILLDMFTLLLLCACLFYHLSMISNRLQWEVICRLLIDKADWIYQMTEVIEFQTIFVWYIHTYCFMKHEWVPGASSWAIHVFTPTPGQSIKGGVILGWGISCLVSMEVDDNCIACGNLVTRRQQAISCDSCQRWQHRTCNTGFTQTEYRRLIAEHVDFEFTCTPCREEAEEERREDVEAYYAEQAANVNDNGKYVLNTLKKCLGNNRPAINFYIMYTCILGFKLVICVTTFCVILTLRAYTGRYLDLKEMSPQYTIVK